jgi:hypothetical protein
MRSAIVAGFISLLVLSLGLAAEKIEVTFVSADECRGNHGVYRWDVKTDMEEPPDEIPAANRVTPSKIGAWPNPPGKFTAKTPRSGREKEWFEVTGKVVLAKAEADGDLHIQLVDVMPGNDVNVVVEVPVRQHADESSWTEIRKTVFGWNKTEIKFPFTITDDKPLDLGKHPVIRVRGKAFWDATHAKKGATNRRSEAEAVAVWEIHPVMDLKEIE